MYYSSPNIFFYENRHCYDWAHAKPKQILLRLIQCTSCFYEGVVYRQRAENELEGKPSTSPPASMRWAQNSTSLPSPILENPSNVQANPKPTKTNFKSTKMDLVAICCTDINRTCGSQGGNSIHVPISKPYKILFHIHWIGH